MRKGVAIGVTTTVIVLSIMVGIASLPDEVLLEPSPFDTSQNSIATQTTTTSISEEGGKVAIQEPVVQEEPVIQEPVVQEEPVIQEPVVQEEPVVKEPVKQEPVAQEEPEKQEPAAQDAEDTEAETQGKKIKVSVSDGISSKMR